MPCDCGAYAAGFGSGHSVRGDADMGCTSEFEDTAEVAREASNFAL